jgi:hypothetical protein
MEFNQELVLVTRLEPLVPGPEPKLVGKTSTVAERSPRDIRFCVCYTVLVYPTHHTDQDPRWPPPRLAALMSDCRSQSPIIPIA